MLQYQSMSSANIQSLDTPTFLLIYGGLNLRRNSYDSKGKEAGDYR